MFYFEVLRLPQACTSAKRLGWFADALRPRCDKQSDKANPTRISYLDFAAGCLEHGTYHIEPF